MAFKESKQFNSKVQNFQNDMGRFTSDEAVLFSKEENETASVNTNTNSLSGNNSKTASPNVVNTTQENNYKNKTENKRLKRLAARTSFANMLRKKKKITDEISGNSKETGDAFKDGKNGIVGTMFETVDPMAKFKKLFVKFALALIPYVVIAMLFMSVIAMSLGILFDVLEPVEKVKNAIFSVISFFVGDDKEDKKTFINEYFSQDEIDEIVEDITCTESQEQAIRYALLRVGFPYSQAQRTIGTAYDCSSLVYYAWRDAGVDIGFGSSGPPTAAEEAKLLEENGKSIDVEAKDFDLQAGDLIFYGASDNGRYKGIYHVAMYIGKGLCVEALNDEYGVVYRDVSLEDAIMVCRP